jgi:hypothetical protein
MGERFDAGVASKRGATYKASDLQLSDSNLEAPPV